MQVSLRDAKKSCAGTQGRQDGENNVLKFSKNSRDQFRKRIYLATGTVK